MWIADQRSEGSEFFCLLVWKVWLINFAVLVAQCCVRIGTKQCFSRLYFIRQFLRRKPQTYCSGKTYNLNSRGFDTWAWNKSDKMLSPVLLDFHQIRYNPCSLSHVCEIHLLLPGFASPRRSFHVDAFVYNMPELICKHKKVKYPQILADCSRCAAWLEILVRWGHESWRKFVCVISGRFCAALV